MEPPKLKLFRESSFHGPAREDAASESRNAPTMPVAVRDLVPLLVDAYQTDRTWLKDFGRESIQVSADLYEVLLAYQQLQRRNAS